MAQDFLQAGERGFASDVVRGANLLGRNQTKGAAHGFGSVMERGLKRDLGVVQTVGIELHLGSAGASAEKVYGAAFTNHFDGPLPGFGAPDGLNDHITATLLRSKRAHRFDNIGGFCGLNNLVRAHLLGGDDLLVALDDGNHVAPDGTSYLDKHQSDGAAADDGDGVADFHSSFVEAAEHAGQRLSHGRVFKADVGRNDEHVGFDDAPRDADVFSVSSVVEEQIFAEIFLMLGAVETHLARRGIQRDHLHALLEAVDALADFFNDSCQLVAEERGRDDHAGVVAALIHLQVGTAGERDLNFDQHLALFDARDRHSFNLEIFFAVQDGGGHFSIHCWFPSQDVSFQLVFPTSPRLNHDFHRCRLRMSREFQRSRTLLQREPVADQAFQVHFPVHHELN